MFAFIEHPLIFNFPEYPSSPIVEVDTCIGEYHISLSIQDAFRALYLDTLLTCSSLFHGDQISYPPFVGWLQLHAILPQCIPHYKN